MSQMLDVIRESNENIRQLDDPDSLKNAAEWVLGVVDQCGSPWLIPASEHAERILGAMLLARGASVSNLLEPAEKAVVFDVNLVSGTVLSRAAREARAKGASYVCAVALHQLWSERIDEEFDDVHVMQEGPQVHHTVFGDLESSGI